MKFQRTDLIERVKAEIDRRVAATEEDNQKATATAKERADAYVAETSAAWLEFANNIKKAVRAGRPVTTADAPEVLTDGWKSGVTVKRAGHFEPPKANTANTQLLRALLNALEAATDDEVTTNALERMGFKIASVFR